MAETQKEIKKLSDCNGSISEFLQVGDLVDGEIVDYFLNVLPPATWTASLIQMGEAMDYVNGKTTYLTLRKGSEGWEYAGTCHRGQTKNLVSIYEQIQQCKRDHASIPAQSNGQEAWICGHPWGVGVRYYPIGTGSIGMREETQDGFVVLLEELGVH